MSSHESPRTHPDTVYLAGIALGEHGLARPMAEFRMLPDRQRGRCSWDWKVLGRCTQARSRVVEGTVYGHHHAWETVLNLAARGAWALWGDHSPVSESPSSVDGARWCLWVDHALRAEVTVMKRRGLLLTAARGWCALDDGQRLFINSDTFFPVLGPMDSGHRIRAMLCLSAFGGLAPIPAPLRQIEASLPSFWQLGE